VAEPIRVAVTGSATRLPWAWWATRFLLKAQGLQPVRVTPASSSLPRGIRGIVIGGGTDIEPVHFGVEAAIDYNFDPARDALEIDLIRWSLAEGVPTIGICRGCQLINVVLGGSLHLDIRPLRQHTSNRGSILPSKWVELAAESRLAGILGRDPIKVNSLHKQAIDKLADGLSVAGRDADGFIQAVELDASMHQYLFGTQWHPEYLLFSRRHRRLFADFAGAIRA
jgi:putative glutamine amidotransferase